MIYNILTVLALIVFFLDFFLPKNAKESLRDNFVEFFVYLDNIRPKDIINKIFCKIIEHEHNIGKKFFNLKRIVFSVIFTFPVFLLVAVLAVFETKSAFESLTASQLVEYLYQNQQKMSVFLEGRDFYDKKYLDQSNDGLEIMVLLAIFGEEKLREIVIKIQIKHIIANGIHAWIRSIITFMLSLSISIFLVKIVIKKPSVLSLFIATVIDIIFSLVLIIVAVYLGALFLYLFDYLIPVALEMVERQNPISLLAENTAVLVFSNPLAEIKAWGSALYNSTLTILSGRILNVPYYHANINWSIFFALFPCILYFFACVVSISGWLARDVLRILSNWVVDHEKHPIGLLAAIVGGIFLLIRLFGSD